MTGGAPLYVRHSCRQLVGPKRTVHSTALGSHTKPRPRLGVKVKASPFGRTLSAVPHSRDAAANAAGNPLSKLMGTMQHLHNVHGACVSGFLLQSCHSVSFAAQLNCRKVAARILLWFSPRNILPWFGPGYMIVAWGMTRLTKTSRLNFDKDKVASEYLVTGRLCILESLAASLHGRPFFSRR